MGKTEGKGKWTEVLRHEETDEQRVVEVRCGQDGMRVRERSDGAATWLAFGALTCMRMLEVGPEGVVALAGALGCGEGEVLPALAAFFSEEGHLLADLQDLLDGAGVAYAYRVRCGNDFALRSAA